MIKVSKEELTNAISKSKSMAEVSRRLGITYKVTKRLAIKYDVFKPNQSGTGTFRPTKYVKESDVFLENKTIPTSVLKKWMLTYSDYKCTRCNISTWLDEDLPLEINHIDGNRKNNLKTNLEFLCPNCHALTPNWRGKNIKKNDNNVKYNVLVSDDDLKNALNSCTSIRQALILVGLAPKGGNYSRAKRLLNELLNVPVV